MKKILLMLIMLCVVVGLSSCKEDSRTDLEKVTENGELVVGFTDFPPFGYMSSTGEAKGIDLEIAALVCEDLGVTFTPQYIDWDTKIMEIKTEKVDVIWNGMTLTDEIAKNLTVSKAYFKTDLVAITMIGKEVAFEDLINKKIAVESNGSSDISLSDSGNYTLDKLGTVSECLLALEGGQDDVFVVDSTYANDYIMKKETAISKYSVSEYTVGSPEDYVIGFRKGSVDLRDAIDASIDKLYTEGKLDELLVTYFGSTEGTGFTR